MSVPATTDTLSLKEPIAVGDFEIEPEEIFEIAQSFVRGQSLEEISERLDIETSDLEELLVRPQEVIEAAVEAKRRLLKLMLYGPIANRMAHVAATNIGRDAVAAAKFVDQLVQRGEKKEEPKKEEETQNQQVAPLAERVTMVLVDGGYERLVRAFKDVTPGKTTKLVSG